MDLILRVILARTQRNGSHNLFASPVSEHLASTGITRDSDGGVRIVRVTAQAVADEPCHALLLAVAEGEKQMKSSEGAAQDESGSASGVEVSRWKVLVGSVVVCFAFLNTPIQF